jgi:hypothetical protein
MKKTIMIILVVLLVAPIGLFAGVFDLSLGVLAQNKLAWDVNEGEIDPEQFTNIDNYAFGADIRARLLFAEVGFAALYEEIEGAPSFSGIATAGLSLDLLGLVRVGLGLGPQVQVQFPEGGDPIFYVGGENNPENFEEALMNTPLVWRATVDLKLGSVLLGVNYMVNTNNFTIENGNYEGLIPTDALFKSGRIGASFLISLF